jgi:hypothetical protein
LHLGVKVRVEWGMTAAFDEIAELPLGIWSKWLKTGGGWFGANGMEKRRVCRLGTPETNGDGHGDS